MTKFQAIDEQQKDSGLRATSENVRRLTGQSGDPATHAVLKKTFKLDELTGTNTDDIASIHATLEQIIEHIKAN